MEDGVFNFLASENRTTEALKKLHTSNKSYESSFSHPDYTVGSRISLDPAIEMARGLKAIAFHRRSGITPCPEGKYLVYICIISENSVSDKLFISNNLTLFEAKR